MRQKIILLSFFLSFVSLSSAYQEFNVKNDYEGRLHLRYPYRIPSMFTVDPDWDKFWSVQSCGICEKLADECSWLRSQKQDIRLKWLRIRSGKVDG